MKYIKHYKLFENINGVLETAKDILIEIEHEFPNWEARSWKENDSLVIVILPKENTTNDEEKEGIKLPNGIIEVINRVANYTIQNNFKLSICHGQESDGINDYSENEIQLEDLPECEVWSNEYIRMDFIGK